MAARRRTQPKHEPRDHTEHTFAADKHVLQVEARVVLDVAIQRRDHGAVRQHGLKAEHRIARHAIANDLVTAGVARDQAAELTVTSRADVDRKEQVVGSRRVLRLLQGHSRLRRQHAGRPIDALDSIQAFQRQHYVVGRRRAALHEVGQATERDDGLSRGIAATHNRCDFVGRFGFNNGTRDTTSVRVPWKLDGGNCVACQDTLLPNDRSQRCKNVVTHCRSAGHEG